MPALRITDRSIDGLILLELDGRLVFDEGDELLRERVKTLVVAGARAFLLDLHSVSYIDSGGIGALVEMLMHVRRRGGRFALLRPSAGALRVLQITHLTSVFEIFHDRELAFRSLAAGTALST